MNIIFTKGIYYIFLFLSTFAAILKSEVLKEMRLFPTTIVSNFFFVYYQKKNRSLTLASSSQAVVANSLLWLNYPNNCQHSPIWWRIFVSHQLSTKNKVPASGSQFLTEGYQELAPINCKPMSKLRMLKKKNQVVFPILLKSWLQIRLSKWKPYHRKDPDTIAFQMI